MMPAHKPANKSSDDAKPARGFGLLSPEERAELGRKGGTNAVNRYALPPGEKAREAGKKGAAKRWGWKEAPAEEAVEGAAVAEAQAESGDA